MATMKVQEHEPGGMSVPARSLGSGAEPSDTDYPPLRSGVAMCALLCLAMIVSVIDRQVLSLMVEPIKADLKLSDFQFSLLQGLAFVVLFSIAGVFLGYLADRKSRRNLIAASLGIWSAATMACGLSVNFVQLFVSRVTVGVGEASLHPATFSLLCDYFPPKRRGIAFGIIGQAGTLGFACALLGGGATYRWIAENHAALGLVGRMFAPWQLCFLIASVPGFLLGLAFFLVKEPRRRSAPSHGGDKSSFMIWFKQKAGLLAGVIAHFAFFLVISHAVLGWMAAYYMRRFGLTIFDAGLATGTVLILGSFGAATTGLLGDRWVKRRAFAGRLRAAAVSFILIVPGTLVWFLSNDLVLSVMGGVVTFFGLAITLSAGPLTVADITPHEYRGRMSAIYFGTVSIFGGIVGPISVASITDFVFRDEKMLNYSLVITVLTAVTLGSIFGLLVMKRYSAELYAQLDYK